MTTIHISPELSQYMAKKGLRHIIVDLAECKTCGGAVAEAFARPAKEKEAEKAPSHTRRLEAEGIEILVAKPTMTIEDEVFLGLRNFLGVKDVTVKGIKL